MSELTKDQQAALEEVTEFFHSPTERFFSVTGQAGTGKTFLTQQLIRTVPEHQIVMTALTNKAVTVLEKFNPDYPCLTIHKFLGLKPTKSKGKTTLVVRKNYDPTQWVHVKYVIVDESSMVPDDLAKRIKRDASDWGRKYVFIGDPYQTPPIDQAMTSVFDMGKKIELTEVVRQAQGNPIIVAATAVRKAISEGSEPKLIPGINEGVGVEIVNRKEFERQIKEAFGKDSRK